jgi:hypothetical protein
MFVVREDFPLDSSGDTSGTTTAPGVESGSDAGAAGDSSGNAVSISTGGLVAIIIVVVLVVILGISTAVLFYVAKKREWTVRETMRRSAHKVKTALTPRRSEFPDSVKDFRPSSRRGRERLASDVPPTPRLRPDDVEKGLANSSVESKDRSRW